MKMTVAERFELYTCPEPNTGCLLWTAATFRHRRGYGAVNVGGQIVKAHRLAWELANGPIPGGLHVLHRCDTPPCCNADHLFLGTNAENTADKVVKGRQKRGTHVPSAKLTDDKVRAIRRALKTGRTGRSVGREFGLSAASVSNIRSGKRWAHVE